MEPVANAMRRACLSEDFHSHQQLSFVHVMFCTKTFVTCVILEQQSSIKQRFERLLQAPQEQAAADAGDWKRSLCCFVLVLLSWLKLAANI